MKAYSVDLRQKVVEAYLNKEGSQRQLAKRFKVSFHFVRSLLKRYRTEGTIEPKAHGGGFAPALAEYASVVVELVEQDNDATLAELGEQVFQHTGVQVSQSTLCRFLQQLHLSRKKSPSTPPKQKLNGSKP